MRHVSLYISPYVTSYDQLEQDIKSLRYILIYFLWSAISAMNRERRKEEIERAYQIQVAAGLRGAAQFGAVGLGTAAIAHRYWPAFRCISKCSRAVENDVTLLLLFPCQTLRKQTLPFKAWLVSIG